VAATTSVIFDFFHTLTVGTSASERRAGVEPVAQALGIPGDVLFLTLGTTFVERATGSRGDSVATMRWVAQLCGHEPSMEQLHAGCELRSAIESSYARNIRPDAVPAAAQLKADGFKLGLMSDCTHELPRIWGELPIAQYFDATVFSVNEGHCKPDQRLYARICDLLDVEPEECLYVGDGGGRELSGADAFGMRAAQLVAPESRDGLVFNPDVDWAGVRITSLAEVIALAGSRRNATG